MASPFTIENGVVLYNGRPVSEMTPEELRAGYGRIGSPGTPTMQFTAGSESGGEFTGYSYDPEYWEEYEETVGGGGDEGYETRRAIRLRPEYQQYYEYNPTGVGSENTTDPQVGYKPEIANRLIRDGEIWGRVGIVRSFGGEGEPIDPSKIVWDEELGYITPSSNIRQPTGSVFSGNAWIVGVLALGMGAAIAATGGLAGLGIAGAGEGAAAGVGEGIAGSGATTGGGGVIGGALEPIAASTIEAANPALASIEGIGASASPTIGASATPVAGIGGGASGLEVSETMRNILAQGTAAGGSAASTAANAAIQQGVQTLGGIGSGGILSSLSPISQRLITSAIGQGVSAISASRRQADAQRFAREQSDIAYQRRREEEDRAREERRIRGTPQAYQFNVTPRGIIGGGMGG